MSKSTLNYTINDPKLLRKFSACNNDGNPTDKWRRVEKN